MPVKLVIFDMAGTTVEDSNNVHDALVQGFNEYNFTITVADANRVMGIPKPVAIKTLLEENFEMKEPAAELVAQIHEAFKNAMLHFYKTDPDVKAKVNAVETFRALKSKGILVGVDTGFSRDIADTIFERLKWTEENLFDYSVTSDEVANGRPYPDMVLKAMKDLNISSAEEVAKVGDTASDLQEGTSAGCRYVIGITTGAFTRDELAKEPHTHLVNDLLEVVEIVLQ
jgi:phosphonatase-like hydrolase